MISYVIYEMLKGTRKVSEYDIEKEIYKASEEEIKENVIEYLITRNQQNH